MEHILVDRDGNIVPTPKVKYIDDKEPTLKEMQKFVGGLIQLIPLEDGRDMIINEEGKYTDNRPNIEATKIAKNVLFEGDFIVGDVMILSGNAKLK